jgi:hypothetical protein
MAWLPSLANLTLTDAAVKARDVGAAYDLVSVSSGERGAKLNQALVTSQDPRLQDGTYNYELLNKNIVVLLQPPRGGTTYSADSVATHLLRFYEAGQVPQKFAFVPFAYLFVQAELQEPGWANKFVTHAKERLQKDNGSYLAAMYMQMLSNAQEEMTRLQSSSKPPSRAPKRLAPDSPRETPPNSDEDE